VFVATIGCAMAGDLSKYTDIFEQVTVQVNRSRGEAIAINFKRLANFIGTDF